MTYQIVYQNRSPQTPLLSAAECGQLFRPSMDAAAFTRWASQNNLSPDGAIIRDSVIVGPGWIRGRVHLRRRSVQVALNDKLRRVRAAKECRQ